MRPGRERDDKRLDNMKSRSGQRSITRGSCRTRVAIAVRCAVTGRIDGSAQKYPRRGHGAANDTGGGGCVEWGDDRISRRTSAAGAVAGALDGPR